MKPLLPLLALALASCASTRGQGPQRIEVDTKAKVLRYQDIETPVALGRNGIGSKAGSNKTPLGTFTVTKEPRHRFGPALRLSGYQGHKRGILIHQAFNSTTRGCIAPPKAEMVRLFHAVENGTELVIF
jgi:L,D-peptidoglycan transpeptidase YkuD (ErfK/YbiS/YcfS/YnhG family)